MNGQSIGPLRYEVAAGIARLTLDRPEKRNALDPALIAALTAALERAEQDEAVRLVTIAGAGKDFCAGADLDALSNLMGTSIEENLADVGSLIRLFVKVRSMGKPVVALVQGRALGGGCGLATACDLVLARETASFGYTEIRIGFVPAIVMTILRRNVSERRAFELIATGAIHTARDFEVYGLINRVFADDSFEIETDRYLRTIVERSTSALSLAKRTLYQQDGMSFETAMRSGATVNVIARTTEDTRAGVARFLEERSRLPEERERVPEGRA